MALPDFLHRILVYLRLDDAALLRRLIQVAVVLALAWVALRLLRGLARRIERSAGRGDGVRLSEAERRGRTLAGLIRSVGTFLVVIGSLLMVLNLFVDVVPLLAGVGVLGLAVSFGAQSLVKDVLGGFFLLLENQYGVGDVVRIAGVDGTVERLSLRSTVLRDGFGVAHFVPNGQIGVVSNLTRQWSRAVVDVGIAHSEAVDRVMTVLREVLREFAADASWREFVMGEPTVAGVQRLSESGVELRTWVNVYPGKHSDAERELRRRIKNRFDRDGIAIALPQRVVHVVGASQPGFGA